jgi:hypothetical protein
MGDASPVWSSYLIPGHLSSPGCFLPCNFAPACLLNVRLRLSWLKLITTTGDPQSLQVSLRRLNYLQTQGHLQNTSSILSVQYTVGPTLRLKGYRRFVVPSTMHCS